MLTRYAIINADGQVVSNLFKGDFNESIRYVEQANNGLDTIKALENKYNIKLEQKKVKVKSGTGTCEYFAWFVKEIPNG